MAKRTWQTAMDELTKAKTGSPHHRHVPAMSDKAFDLIKGVTFQSYRYAWAERAKVAGMPERFAQGAFGHNSNAK